MAERRKFTADFKAKIVLELISGEKGLMEASRAYEIKDSVLSRWKQEFIERAPQIFEQSKSANPPDWLDGYFMFLVPMLRVGTFRIHWTLRRIRWTL
jgi:transposase-like protein